MFHSGTWQVLGMLLAGALFWLQYADLKDRVRPEPRALLLIAFLLGILAAGIAYLAFAIVEWAGVRTVEDGGPLWKACFCFLLIGPIEEGAKVLVALLLVFRWTAFDEPVDGFVYAAAISIGFASLENYIQLPNLPLSEQLVRTATLPLTHTLFAAVWGYGIAHARLCVSKGAMRRFWEAGTILSAMILHGLYDFLIFAYEATMATSVLILAIWVFVIYRARALAKRGGACRVPSD